MPRRSPEEQLRLFCLRVEKTINRRAVQQHTINGAFELSWDEEADGMTFTADRGDEDDLRSLMLDIRMFLSPDEDVSFGRIANLLERRLTDEELREANRENRATWKRALHGDFNMVVNDKRYSAADFFHLAANSDHFHLNDDKAGELARMGEIMHGFGWATTVGMMNNCLLVLHAERNLIQRALDEGVVKLD